MKIVKTTHAQATAQFEAVIGLIQSASIRAWACEPKHRKAIVDSIREKAPSALTQEHALRLSTYLTCLAMGL
jgi:hypothetical protein